MCLVQIKMEMERISSQKNAAQGAAEKWAELIPKVFKLAENENNSKIKMVLGDLGQEYSEGM